MDGIHEIHGYSAGLWMYAAHFVLAVIFAFGVAVAMDKRSKGFVDFGFASFFAVIFGSVVFLLFAWSSNLLEKLGTGPAYWFGEAEAEEYAANEDFTKQKELLWNKYRFAESAKHEKGEKHSLILNVIRTTHFGPRDGGFDLVTGTIENGIEVVFELSSSVWGGNAKVGDKVLVYFDLNRSMFKDNYLVSSSKKVLEK